MIFVYVNNHRLKHSRAAIRTQICQSPAGQRGLWRPLVSASPSGRGDTMLEMVEAAGPGLGSRASRGGWPLARPASRRPQLLARGAVREPPPPGPAAWPGTPPPAPAHLLPSTRQQAGRSGQRRRQP